MRRTKSCRKMYKTHTITTSKTSCCLLFSVVFSLTLQTAPPPVFLCPIYLFLFPFLSLSHLFLPLSFSAPSISFSFPFFLCPISLYPCLSLLCLSLFLSLSFSVTSISFSVPFFLHCLSLPRLSLSPPVFFAVFANKQASLNSSLLPLPPPPVSYSVLCTPKCLSGVSG